VTYIAQYLLTGKADIRNLFGRAPASPGVVTPEIEDESPKKKALPANTRETAAVRSKKKRSNAQPVKAKAGKTK